ncbi:DUF4214 domain-containing protein, partial [Undibacterium sp. Rencai35W]|uniref:DUF4214 domain-containing protein n=1 Tax=Undibacterium sp. Rencai35W TaxID=3413046 RepID=UPI003BF1B5D6
MGIYTNAVQKLYVAYFSRPADPAGLQYWESVVAANAGSTTAVSAAFSQSAEYTAAYAGMNSTQIVNQVYTNLFGRAAEPSGLLYWALLLDQKAISISNVVTQIAAGAQGTDLVAYTSKVSAATSFTAAVDTNLEIVGYSGTPSLTLAKAFIAGVTDAATLATAIVPATLDATVLAVTSAAAGQTFALTTGIDSIVGTAGNDTISSLTAGVLTALDNIDGGAGNDTMSLTSISAIAIP